MSSTNSGNLVRNSSLMLGLINVLQPVSRDDLIGELGDRGQDDFEESLQFLISRSLVRELPHQVYRTTRIGQNALWSNVLTQTRDIHRMWYLSELSDRRRRDEKGGAS